MLLLEGAPRLFGIVADPLDDDHPQVVAWGHELPDQAVLTWRLGNGKSEVAVFRSAEAALATAAAALQRPPAVDRARGPGRLRSINGRHLRPRGHGRAPPRRAGTSPSPGRHATGLRGGVRAVALQAVLHGMGGRDPQLEHARRTVDPATPNRPTGCDRSTDPDGYPAPTPFDPVVPAGPRPILDRRLVGGGRGRGRRRRRRRGLGGARRAAGRAARGTAAASSSSGDPPGPAGPGSRGACTVAGARSAPRRASGGPPARRHAAPTSGPNPPRPAPAAGRRRRAPRVGGARLQRRAAGHHHDHGRDRGQQAPAARRSAAVAGWARTAGGGARRRTTEAPKRNQRGHWD